MAERWRNTFRNAKATVQRIRESSEVRGSPARGGAGDSKSDMEVLDREVRQLTTDLEELRRDMDDYGVNERTLRSMEKDLQDLVAEQQQLKRGGSRAATAASERDRLMARPGAAASAAGPAYGAPASEDVTVRDGRVDVQATMQRHEEAMKEQDELLGHLEVGVGRLKELGKTIGDEADHHNRLLDDMEEEVDDTKRSLARETRRIVHIMQKDGVCWMYVSIVVLIALLVLILIFGFKKN